MMPLSIALLRACCRRLLPAVAILLCAAAPVLAEDAFLPPEQAFAVQAQLRDAQTVVLRWAIAPGYHLYRDRLLFTAAGPRARVLPPALPDGVHKFDENFNRDMETYHGTLAVALPLVPARGQAPFALTVGWQGCADAGLCYPPVTRTFRVDPARPGPLAAMPDDGTQADGRDTGTAGAAAGATASGGDDTSLAQRTLQSGSWWRIGGAFVVFGLLLSLTPCVLPMVPILSSIIVGQGDVTRRRGLLLAAAYSVGMALVYTGLGVAAGLAGEGLAGALQKPWVLLTFGALLVALALSMFDLYQLQLPAALQSRVAESSGRIEGRLQGRRMAGVFLMGAFSALIVGPCVAAPLAGALLYISQTGNAWTGGWALFAMAAGMSVPLLLTGVSAGALLPRTGAWMNGVKKVFGVVLIGMAAWMTWPVLAPLAGGKTANAQAGSASHFTRIRTVAELDTALAAPGRPVMLDFYADWCVACKEMEHRTFADARVAAALREVRLLQADVTANNADDRALMKRFNLFGPPGIILFDAAGREVPAARVIGFLPPQPFLRQLQRARDGS